ncbi:hypothetical protein [Alicycliphilus sp. T452]
MSHSFQGFWGEWALGFFWQARVAIFFESLLLIFMLLAGTSPGQQHENQLPRPKKIATCAC